MKAWKSWGGGGALFCLLLFIPHFLKYHHQDLLIFLAINILIASGYRLMTLTGEWSLIHIIMMGVGAYTGALISKYAGLSFWLVLPMAGITAALTAMLLSFPLFRTGQFYFLIGSFAAGESIRLVWIYFIVPFGGSSGISNIPPPEFLNIDFGAAIPYYYLVLGILIISLMILWRLEKSRFGLTLHAIHWQNDLAKSVGINILKYKTIAFIIASFFAGIGGALKVHYLGSVTPHQFEVGTMLFVLIWVIIGGHKTFWGPCIGVIVLTILDDFLRGFYEIRPAIYGTLLIISIMFLPNGLESVRLGKMKIYLNQALLFFNKKN